MAEKGLLVRVYSIVIDAGTGDYVLTADASCSDGQGGSNTFTVEVSAPTFNPVLPNWRSRLRTAIVAHALNE